MGFPSFLRENSRFGLLQKNSYFFIKGVDIRAKAGIIDNALGVNASNKIAGLCKGSTTDSDSVCEGSNPSPAAKQKSLEVL